MNLPNGLGEGRAKQYHFTVVAEVAPLQIDHVLVCFEVGEPLGHQLAGHLFDGSGQRQFIERHAALGPQQTRHSQKQKKEKERLFFHRIVVNCVIFFDRLKAV